MPHPASMTGFARAEGVHADTGWIWELRSVNGRGLDLRFRMPPGHDALEPSLREMAVRLLKRGNVTANLTLRQDGNARLALDVPALEQALTLALDLQRRIPDCPPLRAEALLALPGVLRSSLPDPDALQDRELPATLRAGFAAALADLVRARLEEGKRIADATSVLLEEIAALRQQAAQQAAGQPAAQRARMLESVRALLAETPALPEERIAQEVALLAARSDVREELDRLQSHLVAARALLTEEATVGRRLDFLVQEFNREANTLSSKSATPELTATALKLKFTIEQLREQAQNIE